MKPLKQFLLFFVYSNLFIAACAVLMLEQTSLQLLNEASPTELVRFVFFSTLCSYSFHYYLTLQSLVPSPRIEWVKKYRYIHAVLFVVGLAGSVYYFMQLAEHWIWLIPAIIATFLYSAPKIPHPLFHLLRKVAIGKTIFLSFIWMYVTTVLPVVVTDKEWTLICTVYAISRFFFIYCICILFDYRDRADDRAAGIKSLITYMSDRNINLLFVFCFLVYVSSTILLYRYDFSLADIIILLIPGLILAFLYRYARHHFSDILYYVILDGLMALSAILMLIPRI